MPTYTIVSDYYADYSVTVKGPMVIAVGVADAISKEQRINVDIQDSDGNVVHSIVRSGKK